MPRITELIWRPEAPRRTVSGRGAGASAMGALVLRVFASGALPPSGAERAVSVPGVAERAVSVPGVAERAVSGAAEWAVSGLAERADSAAASAAFVPERADSGLAERADSVMLPPWHRAL
ncbi:hypothetical protein ACQXVK_00970 [Curtobacterium sp. AB451]|uniref:hypothetical protein n=1 Tax=Curtobacterium sp. AB451 TaxID=3422306 RepID=UPI003D32F425